jgi:glycosyltransferase involved in cell wall biosynthesis
MPKVTVYITAYNYGQFVDQAIESIFKQEFKDWELIIINDGSTDNTKEVISKYSKNAKITIYNQSNKGLNISNNVALRMSRGEYILRLDADDYLHPHALSKLSSFLDSNSKFDLVYPDYFEVDINGDLIREVKLPDITEAEVLDIPAHGACTMFRVDVLKSLGGYKEDYMCQDGFDLWLRFIQKHKPAKINESLFFYRQHPNSISKNKDNIYETKRKIQSDFIKRNTDNLIPKVTAIVLAAANSNNQYKDPFNDLAGKPLILYTIESLLESKKVKNIVISSDSEKVFEFASEHINYIRHMRDDAIYSLDNRSKIISSITDLLNQSSIGSDYFCTLNISSPLRRGKHIDWAVDTAKIFDLDELISVDEQIDNLYIHSQQGLRSLVEHDSLLRQERSPIFRENGAIKLFKPAMNPKRIGHICLLPHESIRIENEFDHYLAESTIKFNKKKDEK